MLVLVHPFTEDSISCNFQVGLLLGIRNMCFIPMRFWYLSESPVLKPNRKRVVLTIEWVLWVTVELGKRVCWHIAQSHSVSPIRILEARSRGHRGLSSNHLRGIKVIYSGEPVAGIAFKMLCRRHLRVQSPFCIRLSMGWDQWLVGTRVDGSRGPRRNQISCDRKIWS